MEIYCVSVGYNEFYRFFVRVVLIPIWFSCGFTEFYWVLPGLDGLSSANWVLLGGLVGFTEVQLGLKGLYWVETGLIGFLPGFTEFLLALAGFFVYQRKEKRDRRQKEEENKRKEEEEEKKKREEEEGRPRRRRIHHARRGQVRRPNSLPARAPGFIRQHPQFPSLVTAFFVPSFVAPPPPPRADSVAISLFNGRNKSNQSSFDIKGTRSSSSSSLSPTSPSSTRFVFSLETTAKINKTQRRIRWKERHKKCDKINK